MSANNQYFAKEIDGRWYGWETAAEATIENPGETRKLHLERAIVADSIKELENKLDERWGYCEYGMTTQPYLYKDDTPIEVVV